MAQTTFNIDQPSNSPEYIDRSKGQTPDLSTASIFESIATIGGEAIKGVNELFKTKIRDEATEGVDAIRDREINMGAQQKGYGTQVPAEINKAADRLSTMKNAKESGQIGDSHYFLLLDSESRRLRSRYPGHREYVDNVMKDLTGVDPANHAISLMKSELNKENKNNELLEGYKWARDHGGAIADALAAGQTPDLETVRKYNAQHGVILANQKAFNNTLDTDKKKREANYTKVDDAATSRVFGAKGLIDGASMEIQGVDTKALSEAAMRFRTEQERGVVDNATTKQLDLALTKYKEDSMKSFNAIMEEVHKDANDRPWTYRSEMSTEGYDKLAKRYNSDVEMRVKAYKAGDVAYMSSEADLVKANEQAAILRLTSSAPYLERLNAHRKLAGDSFTNSMLSFSSPLLSESQRTMDRIILQGISPDKKETIQQSFDLSVPVMKQAGFTDDDIAAARGRTVKGATDALASGKMTKEQADATAYWLFTNAPGTKDFYATALPKDKDFLFKHLVQPGVTENIFSKGNIEVQAKYTQFVDTAVSHRVMSSFSTAGGLARSPSMHGVKYDPETMTFEPAISATAKPGTERTDNASNSAFRMNAVRASQELNDTMSHYKPVADKLKRDPVKVIENGLLASSLMLGPDNMIIAVPKEALPKPYSTETGPPAPKNSGISQPPGDVKSNKESQGDVKDFAGPAAIKPFDTNTLAESDKTINPTLERLRSLNSLKGKERDKALDDLLKDPEVRPLIERFRQRLQ